MAPQLIKSVKIRLFCGTWTFYCATVLRVAFKHTETWKYWETYDRSLRWWITSKITVPKTRTALALENPLNIYKICLNSGIGDLCWYRTSHNLWLKMLRPFNTVDSNYFIEAEKKSVVSEVIKGHYHLRLISFDWSVFLERPQHKSWEVGHRVWRPQTSKLTLA